MFCEYRHSKHKTNNGYPLFSFFIPRSGLLICFSNTQLLVYIDTNLGVALIILNYKSAIKSWRSSMSLDHIWFRMKITVLYRTNWFLLGDTKSRLSKYIVLEPRKFFLMRYCSVKFICLYAVIYFFTFRIWRTQLSP